MTARIDAFAVDVEALAQLVEQPLWRLLDSLTDAPTGREILFQIRVAGLIDRYAISGNREVVHIKASERHVIASRAELQAIPLLQQPARQYLDTGSTYDLLFLLRAIHDCASFPVVELITEGHRRWWIGSLLGAAKSKARLASTTYEELASLLSRMLRRYGCGASIKRYESTPPLHGLPVRPADDDPNKQIAIFDRNECRRLVELFDLIVHIDPTFEAPPLCPQAEADWNTWVREMIGQFMRLRDSPLPNMHMVSFVG